MRLLRSKTCVILVAFTACSLFGEEASSPASAAGQVIEIAPKTEETAVPSVPSRKDQDKQVDRFLQGGFCVLSALFFLAGFLAIKMHEGQRTPA